MSTRPARFRDERFAEFEQPTLPGIGDCEPQWLPPPPPRPVVNCIPDLANYQPSQ